MIALVQQIEDYANILFENGLTLISRLQFGATLITLTFLLLSFCYQFGQYCLLYLRFHTGYDGGDSKKTVQKLVGFGTAYVEVRKMTEEKIECCEDKKCNSGCDCVSESCFRFTQLTTSQISVWPKANRQEQLCHG